MSSILKALKKLEEEKTIRRPDTLNIDAEILRDGTKRSFSALMGLLLAILLFVCGSGATYLYLKREPATDNNQSAASPVLPIARQYATIPSVAGPVEFSRETPQKHSLVSRTIQKNIEVSPRPVLATKPTAKLQTAPLPEQERTAPQTKEKQAVPPSINSKISDTVPLLKLSGIAFQPEGSESVAMVNGVTVSCGSTVEGAKIEDIQKDRVRFSFKGETIEILLGKSSR